MQKSIHALDKALLRENKSEVSEFFSQIEPGKANSNMEKTGEHFGFKVVEVGGACYGLLSQLARVLGYTDTSSLSQLLLFHEIYPRPVVWFEDEPRTRLRKVLGLAPKDSRSMLFTWNHFLLAAMCGQNPETKKIRLYLIELEEAHGELLAEKGSSAQDLAKKEYSDTEQLMRLINTYRKTKDPRHLGLINQKIEKLSGQKLAPSPQMKLDYK